MTNALLLIAVFIPLLNAVASAWLSLKSRNIVSVILATVGVCASIYLYVLFSQTIVVNITNPIIFSSIGETIYLGFSLEKISILFVILVNILYLLSLIYAIGYFKIYEDTHQKRFFGWFSVAITCVLGIAFSANLLTMFLFYEVLTLSKYPLVSHKITDENKKEISTYMYTLLLSSLLLFLPAVMLILVYTGSSDFTLGGIFIELSHVHITLVALIIALLLFGVAKSGLMPLHKWLVTSMVSKTPISGFLPVIFVTLGGIFVIIKTTVFIFGIDYLHTVIGQVFAYNYFLIIPCVSMVWASMSAIFQTNIKKLLAYTSIAQLSYITVAILLLNNAGLMGALFYLFTFALTMTIMFFAVAYMIVTTHKEDISDFVGSFKAMPVAVITLTFAILSLIGVPLTAGFISKWFIIKGIWEVEQYFVLFAMIISTATSCVAFIPVIIKMFTSKVDNGSSVGGCQKSCLINFTLVALTILLVALYLCNSDFINLLTT